MQQCNYFEPEEVQQGQNVTRKIAALPQISALVLQFSAGLDGIFELSTIDDLWGRGIPRQHGSGQVGILLINMKLGQEPIWQG